MTDVYALKEAIKNSGMTITHIAKTTGILRETLYRRLDGKGEFKVSQIVSLSKVLQLTKQERDKIFLNDKLN